MKIVITGGNRGIGAGLATAYRARGDDVIATARQPDMGTSLDVADPASFPHFKTALGDAPVDLLICNAGVYLDRGETLETGYTPADWAHSFAVNVTGVFLTIQSLLSNVRGAKPGKIAIISSQMASSTRAPGGSYIYRASKAAVLNLGRNLATDLRQDGVAIGIYHPGWVTTDMGGPRADIGVDDAVSGLVREFDALNIASTGCFRTWDGRDHAY